MTASSWSRDDIAGQLVILAAVAGVRGERAHTEVGRPLLVQTSAHLRLRERSFPDQSMERAARLRIRHRHEVGRGQLLTCPRGPARGGEFETLVQELFEREGWKVAHTGGHGQADGNIDLILRRGTDTRLVQCKQWTARDLGVDEARKLGGTLLRQGLTGAGGILVTSSGFYPTAMTEAQHVRIELITGDTLVDRLHDAGASDLLHRPTRSDTWLCPDCETPMTLGHNAYGWWLRCPDYGNGRTGKHDLGQDDWGVVGRLIVGP